MQVIGVFEWLMHVGVVLLVIVLVLLIAVAIAVFLKRWRSN